MTSRSELVRAIREASMQYESLVAPEHKAAREMVRQRLAALRRQLATHDEHNGIPANEDIGSGWQLLTTLGLLFFIVAVLLHACNALTP